jgi:hypothetical protein
MLMSAVNIPRILDGSKTQTRRIIEPQPVLKPILIEGPKGIVNGKEIGSRYREEMIWNGHHSDVDAVLRLMEKHYAPHKVGSKIWLKETWRQAYPKSESSEGIVYRADAHKALGMAEYSDSFVWKPSIFMPRKFSRITLEVTNVRVERLQEISEDDAKAEGVIPCDLPQFKKGTFKNAYIRLWESINGKGSWAKNPWVWTYEFRRIKP